MEQTFVSATAQPADDLGSVLPSAEAFTIGVRHSLVRLPASDFRPRAFHPGCGYFSTDSYDPAAPLGESVRHQFIDRHHLKPGEKLIYYVDATAPPEIQEIMIEATESWNAAFAEIGLPDAIDAQVMPPDVDPMDVRHNVILWVHRKLRGWSYAQWIADPRTGEIFSSRIILDSQRIRLDYLIAEAMLSPWDGKADDAVHERIEALVHDRLRILVAHEVGHTLGLRHNFAANTYGRESVMDYPFPQWKLGRDGRITWDDAYKYRPGAWDHAAIRYGYMTAEDADESAALQDVLADMSRENLLFLTDPDAGTLDGAHPLAHRWDTEGGEQERRDALFFLRRMALDRFSIHAIREGKPMTELEERFVHVYLLHRYEIEAAAKLLGGVEYNYARRGEAVANEIVASDRQKAALNWLINCLRADHLTVPAEALALLVPQSHGFARDPERVFVGYAGRPFDPLAAAGSLADHIAAHLLEPSRATRLLEQKALRRQEFGFADVVDELIKKVWLYRPEDSVRGEYQRVASHALLRRLMLLAKNNETQPQVRAIAHAALYEMRVGLEGRLSSRGFIDWRAFDRYSYRLIERFDEDPDDAEIVNFLELPIGPPIGGGAAACGVAER